MRRLPTLFLLSCASAFTSFPAAFTSPVNTNYLHGIEAQKQDFEEIYQMGLDAMYQEDYLRAKATFSSILRHQRSFLKNNKEFYFSTKIKLAVCESNLGNFIEADQLLNKLRKENPPEKALIIIETFRARLKHKKGNMQEAFLILYNLEQKTQSNLWEKEELLFFQEIENKLNQHFLSLLSRLEKLKQSSLYELSLPIYENLLKGIERGHFPQELRHPKRKETLLFELANAYYQMHKYIPCLDALRRMENPEKGLKNEITYLQALCFIQLKEPSQAQKHLLMYLKQGGKERLYEAKLQLGILFFKERNIEEAKEHLAYFSNQPLSREKLLATITLAKIHLHQNHLPSLIESSEYLWQHTSKNDPLIFEVAFLKGETAFLQKQYPKAIEYYEQALPHHNKEKAQWYPTILYNLAWCYLEMGRLEPSQQQSVLWDKAKTLLSELITFQKHPQAALALARLYLLNETEQEKVEELLSKVEFTQVDEEAESLYLRAKATTDKTLKMRLFETLTDDNFQSSPYHSLAWYYQGTALFEKAQLSPSSEKKQLEKSIYFLTKAYKHLKDQDPEKAFLAIKYTLHAYHHLGTKMARYQSLSLIKKLFQQYPELQVKNPKVDEIWYLQAMNASQLLDEEESHLFLQSIEEAKKALLENTPDSPYIDKTLYLLAMVYYQKEDFGKAEENFQPLIQHYPQSEHRAQALYWLAESLEWQEKDPKQVQTLRKEIFNQYPSAPFAAEAYFHAYSFSDYLQGEESAFQHLKQMPEKFPQSNLNIVTHYLIGLQHQQDKFSDEAKILRTRNLEEAFSAFQRSKNLFLKQLQTKQLPEEALAYYGDIYFKSLSELPIIKNTQAKKAQGTEKRVLIEQATELYAQLISEIENPESIYSKYFNQTAPSHLLQESYYELSKLYLLSNRDPEAEETLEKLQRHLQKEGIQQGFYLSRSWFQLGKIKGARQEHKEALSCFLQAEKAASYSQTLSTEKKLDLWLHIAKAHEKLGQYDAAMKQLSSVINEFVSSDKRIEAMYLRALIYERQGKRDFALKQLESTSKNKGKWAEVALEKLRQDYGFQ